MEFVRKGGCDAALGDGVERIWIWIHARIYISIHIHISISISININISIKIRVHVHIHIHLRYSCRDLVEEGRVRRSDQGINAARGRS